METKIITKMITREEKVQKYVAFDGKEFDDCLECEAYEEECKQKLLDKIEHAAKGFAPCDGNYHDDENTYTWYRPNSKDDLAVLNDIIEDCTFDETLIGSWVCVETDESGSSWLTTVDHCIGYVENLFGKLGFEVSITKKEEK